MRSTTTSCCAAVPAPSWLARCSIGRRRPAAICCKRRLRLALPRAAARCHSCNARPLPLYAGRLGGWPPLVSLGLAQRAERFRCLLGARRNDLAELGELGAHRGIGE